MSGIRAGFAIFASRSSSSLKVAPARVTAGRGCVKPAATTANMRILIVEDEPDLLAQPRPGVARGRLRRGHRQQRRGRPLQRRRLRLRRHRARRDAAQTGRLGNSEAPPQNQKDARAHAHRARPVPRPRARASTPARTITSSSRSICRNCLPGCARSSAAARTRRRTSSKSAT